MSGVYIVGQPALDSADSPPKTAPLMPPVVDEVLDWKMDKAKAGVDPWRVLYKVRWLGYSKMHDSWEPKDAFDGPPHIDDALIAELRSREPDKKLPSEMWTEVDDLNRALSGGAGKKGRGKHGGVGKAWQVASEATSKTKTGAKKAPPARKSRAKEDESSTRATPSKTRAKFGRPKADPVPKPPKSKRVLKPVVEKKVRTEAWAAPPPRGTGSDADSVMSDVASFVEDDDLFDDSRSADEDEKAASRQSPASDVTPDRFAEDSDDDEPARSTPPVTRHSEMSKQREQTRLTRTTSGPTSQLGRTLLKLPSFKTAKPVAAEPPSVPPDVAPAQGASPRDPALGENRARNRLAIPSHLPPASKPPSRLPPARTSVDPAPLRSQNQPHPASLLRSLPMPAQEGHSKAYIHPSRAAFFNLARPPSEPDVPLLQPTPAPSVAGSTSDPRAAKRRKTSSPLDDGPAAAPARAVVLPPRETYAPALAAPARKADFFNQGLERTKSKAGFVVLDPQKLIQELRQLSGELPPALARALSSSSAAQEAIQSTWNIGKRWSDDFKNRVKDRTAWIFCPIAHATLKQLADASPARKAFKKKKVQAHHLALQVIIEGFDMKQADELRDDVEVAFVHASEEGDFGRRDGPLAKLDDFRLSGGPESVCYSFGGKLNGFYQLWCTHAAVTFSPGAFLDDPEEMEKILVQASKLDKDTTRSVCVWAPAAFAATGGPLSGGSTFANSFEEPEDLFKRLVKEGTIHLAKPSPTSDTTRLGKVFPAPEDEETLGTQIKSAFASVESIVQSIDAFRRQYVQVRHWFVIVTAEEMASVIKAPGIELILRKDAPAALFV